jgi:hypothetical protein
MVDFGQQQAQEFLRLEVLLANGQILKSQGIPLKVLPIAEGIQTILWGLPVMISNSPQFNYPLENFSLKLNRTEVPLVGLSHRALPLDILFLVDVSSSLRAFEEQILKALALFSRGLSQGDRASLAFFHHQVIWQAPLGAVDPEVFLPSQLTMGGETAFFDALGEGIAQLKASPGRKNALVVFSDGLENRLDSGSEKREAFLSVVQEAQRKEITLLPVALGPRADLQALELLADLSGGQLFTLVTPEQSMIQIRRVFEALRHQYVLYFEKPEHLSGWVEPKVRLRQRGVTLHVRQRLFLP